MKRQILWFRHNLKPKDSGIKVPEVHEIEKGVDPNLRPEWLVKKLRS